MWWVEFDTITVRHASPDERGARRLLDQAWARLAATTPPHARFDYDLDGLCAPHVTLFVATRNAVDLGCAAYAHVDDAWGELKSMFVVEAARGTGVADALVRAVEAEARAAGARALRLETGVDNVVARAFYARHGFRDRKRFEPYPDEPLSHFMEKPLAEPGASGSD